MKLAKALNEKQMDVRLMDRLLGEGKLSKAQVDEYLKNLDDSEGRYERIGDNTASTELPVTEQ